MSQQNITSMKSKLNSTKQMSLATRTSCDDSDVLLTGLSQLLVVNLNL